jgi:hypothetical protein
MMDPAKLAVAIGQAEEALASDPQGHLPLAQRQAIWAALGPADAEGRCTRTRLAVAATRRVLPIWEKLWPANRLPHQLLDLAEQVCRGEVDGATLTELRSRAQTEFDDISWASDDKSAVAVGYAAHRALAAAIRDELFDLVQPNTPDRDEDRQPDEHDSAYFAAAAASGGAPWQPGSSAERRRDYWLWWLTEAVPAIAQGV